jgi:surface antigen
MVYPRDRVPGDGEILRIMGRRAGAVFGSIAIAVALAFAGAGQAQAENYWQCVPFARMTSGIQIFGDAWTWWQQAAGKYAQGFSPKAGAVLVFKPNGVMTKGHVAVVSHVLTDRVIQVNHANWSIIDGGRGQIERDVTVIDVSKAGDWSLVKVWFDPSRDIGRTTYPTYGFIYQSPEKAARSATENAVRTLAQTAISQFAAAVPSPGSGASKLLSQATDSTDRIAALLQSATSGGSDNH